MRKKIECLVRHFGDDIPASQIGSIGQLSNDLFSGFADTTSSIKSGKAGCKSDSIIVAGRNFGNGVCGRDLFTDLKKSGTSAIIANSFSREFYRGAVNHGIAVIENSEANGFISDGEMIFVDLENGEIKAEQGTLKINPIPDIHFKIYLAGGLIPYTRKLLGK